MLDQGGATWLPLDPWIATDEDWPDRRIVDQMDLNGNEFRQRFLGGEFCTGALDAPGACPTLVEALSTEVETYLADHGETDDFDDLAAPRPSAIEAESILPAAMVGRIVSVDGYGIELPEDLRFRLGVRAVAGVETLLETTLDVAQLSAGEAVIWYEPATAEDEDVVEALGGYLWDVPPYLVNVVPVVMVGQDVIARAEGPTRPGIGMGQSFMLELMMTTPAGLSWSWTNSALAGVPVGLGVSAGHQGYETPYEQPASTIQLLSKLTGDYLDGVVDAEEQLAALDHLALVHTMPTTVAVSAVIEPAGTLGMVTDLQFLGIQIDADIWGSGIAGGSGEARKRWRDLARLGASALERRLFEDYQITSISADMALVLAQAQGIEILHINAGNLGAALATLPYDQSIESEIEAWVLSGGEADVPVTPLDFVQWSGVGYVLRDPATGEAKYQLAGGLSGGMTVLPPKVDAWLLSGIQPWPPLSTPVVHDPNAAAVIEVRRGFNGQIGRAGSEAGVFDGNDPITVPLLVEVRTRLTEPVADVPVRFEIAAGDGYFLNAAGGQVLETSKITDEQGRARVQFIFDPSTATVPYYGKLDDEDHYPTQLGANLIRITTTPVQLHQLVWAFSAPGPLADLEGGRFQWSAVPAMLAGRAEVVAVDELGNPIANTLVNAILKPVEPSELPGALLERTEAEAALAEGGTVLLDEIASPLAVLEDKLTGWDGKFQTYVVLGTGEDGDQRLDFEVRQDGWSEAGWVTFTRQRPDDGEILYSWSGRPVGSQGQWIEAYEPGSEIGRPFVLDLFRMQDGEPERAPRDGARAIFAPLGCPAGTELVGAPEPSQVGRWATGLQLGTTPGRCEVTAVVEEQQGDGNWQTVLSTNPSAPVWAVTMGLQLPLPVVVLGQGNTPTRDRVFQYTILPESYVPETAAVVFREGGKVVGLTQAEGRGEGRLILPAGVFSFTPGEWTTMSIKLNRELVWGAQSSRPVFLENEGPSLPLDIVKVEIVRDNDDDHTVTRADEPVEYVEIGHWGEDTTREINIPSIPLQCSGPFALTGYDNNEDGPSPVLNDLPPESFVDKDPDRFYVRVYDSSNQAPNVTVRLATLLGDGQTDDDPTDLTLERVPGSSPGVFVSPSQLLTTQDLFLDPSDPPATGDQLPQRPVGGVVPPNDDDFAANDGVGGLPGDNEPDDRTHRATIDGSVVVEYDTVEEGLTADSEAPVCRRHPEKRRVLQIRVHVLFEPTFPDWPAVDLDDDGLWDAPDFNGDGIPDFVDTDEDGVADAQGIDVDGDGVRDDMDLNHDGRPDAIDVNGDGIIATVAGLEVEAASFVATQVRWATALWAQACIKVERVGPILFERPQQLMGDGSLEDLTWMLLDKQLDDGELKRLAAYYRRAASPNVLEIILGPVRGVGVSGISLTGSGEPNTVYDRTFAFVGPGAHPSTLAHEIGHCLDNRASRDSFRPSSCSGVIPEDWNIPTNPTYVFYPGGDWGGVIEDGQLRITHETEDRCRVVRDPSWVDMPGNVLLREPNDAKRKGGH